VFYKAAISQNASQPETAIQEALVHVVISDISLKTWETLTFGK